MNAFHKTATVALVLASLFGGTVAPVNARSLTVAGVTPSTRSSVGVVLPPIEHLWSARTVGHWTIGDVSGFFTVRHYRRLHEHTQDDAFVVVTRTIHAEHDADAFDTLIVEHVLPLKGKSYARLVDNIRFEVIDIETVRVFLDVVERGEIARYTETFIVSARGTVTRVEGKTNSSVGVD